MYILILILPLISSIFCGLYGRKLGYQGVKIFSCVLLMLTSLISFLCFFEVIILNSNIQFYLWSWFDLGLLYNNIQLQFDHIVCSMLILVTLVSFFVHLFSTSYMDGDPHLPRFMSYLSLFTFFMIILVTSNNLVQLFIGWEGVGLCSYLLIGFWYTRIQANKSAIKAMILNKVGDIGLLLGMVMIWYFIGSFDYNTIFSYSFFLSKENINLDLISFLLLIGVIGKSAQIGLHTWLPDAMEGPTPVSALIHAATMVTAGVFLIIRMSPFFENTPTILIVIVLLGSLTAFFTSSIGLTQNDLKKVIAYSTCSQLGYMVMICGFSQYNTGLFHLINHGFFKALLFLSAGSIIHALTDEQDFRKMGSMNLITPFSYICIVIGSISLMGLPFLTGFYSKDLIIELIYGEHYLRFALWLGVLSAFITAFYSFRLIHFTFFNNPQSNIKNFSHSHEGPWNLRLPLFLLLVFSIIIGYFLEYFILKDELPIIIENLNKFLPLIVSLIGSILSLILGFLLFKWWKLWMNSLNIKIYSFTNGAWYFDNVFNYYITSPIIKLGLSITYKLIDNQLLEFLGPTNVYNNFTKNSSKISNVHSGKLSIYVLLLIIFIFFSLIKF
uniref:NADH-ubiquinone oxidoreductase chain 5 n=1 Tax=Blackfordia virginica TaxID=47071 RepID=A0A7U0QCX0_9CNID|nr:NADH dehydrogenase subunit 5 [Blackfordia virginica]QQW46709.1 NADH dehydrogenase subunit 5 [Blackfordia virginica]